MGFGKLSIDHFLILDLMIYEEHYKYPSIESTIVPGSSYVIVSTFIIITPLIFSTVYIIYERQR